ncbi:hypothetical protein E2320_006430 [Naja naja]|nr:hypothetical protein E2320_006430 [Naja naja]
MDILRDPLSGGLFLKLRLEDFASTRRFLCHSCSPGIQLCSLLLQSDPFLEAEIWIGPSLLLFLLLFFTHLPLSNFTVLNSLFAIFTHYVNINFSCIIKRTKKTTQKKKRQKKEQSNFSMIMQG